MKERPYIVTDKKWYVEPHFRYYFGREVAAGFAVYKHKQIYATPVQVFETEDAANEYVKQQEKEGTK